jgi:hypothetical protein
VTKETATWVIWFDEVVKLAKVSIEQCKPYRERMCRAYQMGEPAWMAADELGFRVRQSEKMQAADREVAFLQSTIHAALGRGR